jgi:tight adherence protein B
MAADLLAVLILVAAAICWAVVALPELPAAWRWLRRTVRRWLRVDRAAVDLAQAGLPWLSPWSWTAARWCLAAVTGLVAYLVFGLAVLALVAALAAYHLAGLGLEARRRQAEAIRQRALLEAMRFGVSVMSRSGGALQMLQTLAAGGPFEARPIFRELLADADSERPHLLLDAVRRTRVRLADPLFDDISIVLALHWRQGGRLVPALEALVADWNEALRLQRDARALRAGVEASVLLLTVLPFVFLLLMRVTAPSLLAPLATPLGEVVFACTVAWMVLGYRVMQRMSAAPLEERLELEEAVL